MEAAFQSHPVPQNVTSFEFHLVGDMTLKQFGYLAAGLGFAYLIFVLFAADSPYIAWPVIAISSLFGAAFAFLPIYERPLDHWVSAFFKAVSKPTKMSYKSQVLTKEDPLFKKRLPTYLKMLSGINNPLPTSALINPVLTGKITSEKSMEFNTNPQPVLNQTAPLQSTKIEVPLIPNLVITTPAQTKPVPLTEGEQLKKTVELAKDAQDTQTKVRQIETQIEEIKTKAATPGENPREYVEKFENLLGNLQDLNKEAGELAKQMAIVTKTTSPKPSPLINAVKAQNIPTLTLTTFPNIINGVVTDAQGNYVENAIIVAHDKQGLPVRALKSNKLGQFIAATPLPDGTYTMVVEKEGMIFDVIEVELKGEIMQPIISQAKKAVALS